MKLYHAFQIKQLLLNAIKNEDPQKKIWINKANTTMKPCFEVWSVSMVTWFVNKALKL